MNEYNNADEKRSEALRKKREKMREYRRKKKESLTNNQIALSVVDSNNGTGKKNETLCNFQENNSILDPHKQKEQMHFKRQKRNVGSDFSEIQSESYVSNLVFEKKNNNCVLLTSQELEGINFILPLAHIGEIIRFRFCYQKTSALKTTVRHHPMEFRFGYSISQCYDSKVVFPQRDGIQSYHEKGSSSNNGLELDNMNNQMEKKIRASRGYIKKSGRDILKCVPTESAILKETSPCKFCAASRILHESESFCCSKGTVSLYYSEPPFELARLMKSQNEDGKHFKQYIRAYNNLMAFTSLGVKYDKNLANSIGTGVYVFRVLGQIHHFINPLSSINQRAEYLQLYFYDPENEIDNRKNISNCFRENIVEYLVRLSKENPYAKFFRSLKDEKNLTDVKIVIKADPKMDQKVFNPPTQNEVALIWNDTTDASDIKPRDIIIYGEGVTSYKIQYYYSCYDTLQYFILHPKGEPGWHTNIKRSCKLKDKAYCSGQQLMDPNNFSTAEDLLHKEFDVLEKRQEEKGRVAIREYYAYKLQIRPSQTNLLLLGGRLLQQYIVDMYVKIETSRLDFFRYNQEKIRADLYKGIVEALAAGETKSSNVGKRIILPSSFIGGPRDMTRRYLDAMALVRKFGRPDLFLTMTCNPSWPEITELLEPGQNPHDRPDIIARIFKAKLIELKNEILTKMIFGPVAAYVFVIEFQKRGLPHVHMLIILNKDSKLTNPNMYNEIVSAEIPDKDKESHLYNMVMKHMMHGPCGVLNMKNSCMKKNGLCKSNYPKAFQEETMTDDSEYPIYRRRNDGRIIFIRNANLDNRWVVPYNPYLLAMFNCHINVEICSTIKAVKYLYKYIYKGHDRVAFNILNDKSIGGYDEINAFQSGRWVSPPEAAWRIFAFPMYGMKPSVLALQIHLENEQYVCFHENNVLKNVIYKENAGRTMLTEFFLMNSENDLAKSKNCLYIEFPEVFVWNSTTCSWSERKAQMSVGRINCVSPVEGEKYYLRLLLTKVRAPTSFISLLTYNGEIAENYRDAAVLRGLVLSDNHIQSCLEEASQFKMPAALRQMFCSLLVYCNPANPKQLWELFEYNLSEDISRLEFDSTRIRNKTLSSIALTLESMGKNIMDFGLIENIDCLFETDEGREIRDELNIPISEFDLLSKSKLNNEQLQAYNAIMEKVLKGQSGAFFIDGPGGTGKTFLYRAILASVRSQNKVALATASSGVAASLLPGGRTAHSRFKIPINLENILTCGVGKRSGLANLIRKADLIIWDEASMANKLIVESLNRMLQDITNCGEIFGGKVIVFGGDFRQVLPVIRFGRKDEALNASLVQSTLWPQLIKLRLIENMRAKLDPEFSNYLMRIGDGVEPTNENDEVKIPNSMLIEMSPGVNVLDRLIDSIYPNICNRDDNTDMLINHAILTPRNESVNAINSKLMTMFPGTMKVYTSFDETINPKQQSEYEDLLHTFTPNGLPPYELALKINCPVMLMRNINPAIGLCNGTRIICRKFEPNVIHGQIAVGDREGQNILLHRIPMQPSSEETYPVLFKRTQFPIRPSFCMTINKAQGQTLDCVGLYLPQPVFSHGQLYVALSRARIAKSVKVLLEHTLTRKENTNFTSNVVYKEVFDLAKS